jgi:hypothetical protein
VHLAQKCLKRALSVLSLCQVKGRVRSITCNEVPEGSRVVAVLFL